MDDERIAAIFPDVPPPSEDAWRLVSERLDAAAAEELAQILGARSRQGRRHARALRHGRVLWVTGGSIAAAVAAALVALALLPATTPPPRSHATSPAWRLTSSIGTAYARDTSARSPDAITCPTASTCYVVTDSEVTMQGLANGAGPNDDEEPLPTGAEVTHDGGSSWQALPVPPGTFITTPFTCPSATSCMAAAISLSTYLAGTPSAPMLLSTSDGGTTWSEKTVSIPPDPGPDPGLIAGDENRGLTQPTCFTARTCVAFGTTPYGLAEEGSGGKTPVMQTVLLRTRDGGSHWTATDLPWESGPTGAPAGSNAEPATFSCPNAQTCIGVATVISGGGGSQSSSMLEWRTDDGGATWTHSWIAQFPGPAGLGSVTCADVSHCLALADVAKSPPGSGGVEKVLATSDGGSSWTSVDLPVSSGFSGSSIGCRGVSDCWITGSQGSDGTGSGVILATTDGGATWATQPVPPGLGWILDVTCPSTTCYAVGAKSTSAGITELLTNGTAGNST